MPPVCLIQLAGERVTPHFNDDLSFYSVLGDLKREERSLRHLCVHIQSTASRLRLRGLGENTKDIRLQSLSGIFSMSSKIFAAAASTAAGIGMMASTESTTKKKRPASLTLQTANLSSQSRPLSHGGHSPISQNYINERLWSRRMSTSSASSARSARSP